MKESLSLNSIFAAHKTELAKQLEGLVLPQDAKKIQSVVADHLNKLFDEEGDYRQNLTQAEDYILQAAMSLLNAQQNIAKELISAKKEQKIEEKSSKSSSLDNCKNSVNKEQFPKTLSGTLIGGAAGAVLGTWGAVLGAIAGTAIVLYYASESKVANTTSIQSNNNDKTTVVNTPLNIDTFIIIVSNVCTSVDALIDAFRSQVNRVVDKYENKQKPSIEVEYRFLLETIQSLLGYERTHSESEDKYTKKLQTRIEDLAESLENYNLSVENFNGSNDIWFEKVVSPETKEVKMVYPAIVKDNLAVIKGKIFIPQK